MPVLILIIVIMTGLFLLNKCSCEQQNKFHTLQHNEVLEYLLLQCMKLGETFGEEE